MDSDGYKRKRTKPVRLGDKTHGSLARYKKLTGMELGEQIDNLVEQNDTLAQVLAMALMVPVSPEAMRVLEAFESRDGESPADHIDRLLNAELGLVDWKKISAKYPYNPNNPQGLG